VFLAKQGSLSDAMEFFFFWGWIVQTFEAWRASPKGRPCEKSLRNKLEVSFPLPFPIPPPFPHFPVQSWALDNRSNAHP